MATTHAETTNGAIGDKTEVPSVLKSEADGDPPVLLQLAVRINEAHDWSRRSALDTLRYAAEAGRLLLDVKERLPHGEFESWVRANCLFTPRWGRQYMKVARRWSELEPKIEQGRVPPISAVGLLTPGPSSPMRDALMLHLKRIQCGGLLKECVFEGGFATNALLQDHLLLVIAPPLEGAPELEQPVGVTNLHILWKAARAMRDGDLIRVDDQRLAVGKTRLPIREPRTIVTRIDPQTVEGLVEKVGQDTIPLFRELIADVGQCWGDLRAETVDLIFGPNGGMIRVSSEAGQCAELRWSELRADPGYQLTFGEHFVNVLSLVGDQAALRVGGPTACIAIEDEGYTYILSPRSQAKIEPPPDDNDTLPDEIGALDVGPALVVRLRRMAAAEGLRDDDSAAISCLLDAWDQANESGAEYRKVRADFARFCRLQLETGDYDAHLPLLMHLAEAHQLSEEEALWLGLLYMAYYHEGSMWIAFSDPDVRARRAMPPLDLPFTKHRRNLRTRDEATRHFADLQGIDSLSEWVRSATTWDQLLKRVEAIRGNGRWASYTTAELLVRLAQLPLEPDTFEIQDSSGPRRGLEVLGMAQTEEGAMCVREMLSSRGIEVSVSVLESLLCDWGGMNKGSFYPGRNIDRQQGRILDVEGQTGKALTELWEARRAVYPPWALGELRGWVGIDKARLHAYERSGEILEADQGLVRLAALAVG